MFQYLLLLVSAPVSRCFDATFGKVGVNVVGEVAVHVQLTPGKHISRVKEDTRQPLADNNSINSTIEQMVQEVREKLKEEIDLYSELSAEDKIKKLRGIAPKRPTEEATDISKDNALNAERKNIDNVTVAPRVECLYQYPKQEQMEVVLGSMMNQLTKMFMRMQVIIQEEDANRSQETRFRVISQANNAFFDDIYGNMTDEFKSFYNTTTQSTKVSENEQCSQQVELRRLWQELLGGCQRALRRAVRRCVAQYLKRRAGAGAGAGAGAWVAQPGHVVRARMRRALRRDLARARAAHLAELCDTFQLCYDDLL